MGAEEEGCRMEKRRGFNLQFMLFTVKKEWEAGPVGGEGESLP